MKAASSKSATEYIELADVVGVYLDVRLAFVTTTRNRVGDFV
jgi:hypothetical protein